IPMRRRADFRQRTGASGIKTPMCRRRMPMTTLVPANASTRATVSVGARIFSSLRRALSRLGAAYAHAQQARLEAEIRRLRHRINGMDDDDRSFMKSRKDVP